MRYDLHRKPTKCDDIPGSRLSDTNWFFGEFDDTWMEEISPIFRDRSDEQRYG